MVLVYPEYHKRGTYLAYWLASRIVGQLIGGAVSLGVNVKSNRRGHISVNTYLIFISTRALEPFFAVVLSPLEKVQRSDETPVKIVLFKSLKVELRAMRKLVHRKEIPLLTPMMFQSVFSEAFFSTYNASYFTVRSRALASLVTSSCVIVANFGLGFFLNWRRPAVNRRVITRLVLVYAFEASLYVIVIVICKRFEARVVKHTFDRVDEGFGQAVCIYILKLVGFNLMYEYLYWLIGTVNKGGGEVKRLRHYLRD